MRCCALQKLVSNVALDSQIEQFIHVRRQNPRDDVDYYRQKSNLESAIVSASRAERNDGKRHPHQRRLRNGTIQRAQEALLAARDEIQACKTFDELHDLIYRLLWPIWGAGVLYVYDTAFRLGQYLRIQPTRVFLHAGTRVGARNLGLPAHKPYLEMDELPEELLRLSAGEAEDFLCIYKDGLARTIC
jgi:hypothetical protein